MAKGSLAVAYSMKKKAKKCAEGGDVDSGKNRHENEVGVHFAIGKKEQKGTSITGLHVRGAKNLRAKDYSGPIEPEKREAVAKDRETMAKEGVQFRRSELKKMKGPHGNYADGGDVEPEPQPAPVSEEEAKKFAQGMCPSCGYSDGGMVANAKGPGAEEDSADYDDLALRDGLEFKYTGSNSGDLVGRALARKKR